MVTATSRWRVTRFPSAAVLVIVLIAGFWGWSVVDELRFAGERIGIVIDATDEGVQIERVSPRLPAERAGLRDGDLLVELGGQPVPDTQALDSAFDAHFRPGQSIDLVVLRDGVRHDFELTPGTTPDLAGLLARLVLVCAYLGLGLLAARYRTEDLRAWLLMMFVAMVAIELALPEGYTLDMAAVYAIVVFWMLLTGAQIGLELHLVSLIPGRLPVLERRRWIVPAYYVLGMGAGVGLAAFAAYQWFWDGAGVDEFFASVQHAILLAWALAVGAILVWQSATATEPRKRHQAMLVLLGVLPWLVYILTTAIHPDWFYTGEQWSQLLESLALLAFPVAVFVAIFRYGLFDVELLVRRGLVYGSVTGLLLALMYALLTAALPTVREHFDETIALWLVTATALIVGIGFRPLRHAIELGVERGLFPERHALRQRLIQVAGELANHDRLPQLAGELADKTARVLGVHWAAVAVLDEPSGGLDIGLSSGSGAGDIDRTELARLLHTSSNTFPSLARAHRPVTVRRLRRRESGLADELREMGIEVLVPLYLRRQVIGILCLAGKRNGQLFAREELELLDLFSHQIAVSFENLRLFQDATYEVLTGLLRREAILKALNHECERACRYNTSLTVFMIDIDQFKLLNDAHGHLFGDRVLKEVAHAMRERARAVDRLGRYGGEEFLLVLPDTDLEGGWVLAEQYRSAVERLKFEAPGGEMVGVTMSIGIAAMKPDGHNAETLARMLIEAADVAVYMAKAEGRNRVSAHTL